MHRANLDHTILGVTEAKRGRSVRRGKREEECELISHAVAVRPLSIYNLHTKVSNAQNSRQLQPPSKHLEYCALHR